MHDNKLLDIVAGIFLRQAQAKATYKNCRPMSLDPNEKLGS